MRHRSLFLCGCVLFLMAFVFSLPVQAADLTSVIDGLFKKWDNSRSPGAAIALVKDGKVIFQKGYGMANLKEQTPISSSTVFNWGSNSKQFTVFAILLLEEEGRLFLDDDVRLYIPEVPDFGQTITLQHLIDHTSGMRDYLELMAFGGWNLLEDIITKEQALAIVSRQKSLNFSPGEQFMYCNTGFMLLAEIVARLSGKTFAQFTQERIFAPLGMAHTEFADNHRKVVPHYADPYYPGGDGNFYLYPVNMSSVGEGGLLSTLDDIAQWDRNFYEAKVGSFSILEKMHKKGKLNNGTDSPFSAGLIVTEYKGRQLVYHGGDLGGYHAQIVRFPNERFSIITASNTAELTSSALVEMSVQIADAYFANPGSTSIPNFRIHEPSLQGWGAGEPVFYAPDLDSVISWYPMPYVAAERKSPLYPESLQPQMTSDQAQEYIGRYYSEELDSFMDIVFDGDRDLRFKLPRSPLPYFFSVRTVRRDTMTVNESDQLKGNFLRNAANEITGFKISNPRVIDLEYHKADIVTKK